MRLEDHFGSGSQRNERVKLAASFWNNVGAGMVIGDLWVQAHLRSVAPSSRASATFLDGWLRALEKSGNRAPIEVRSRPRRPAGGPSPQGRRHRARASRWRTGPRRTSRAAAVR